LRWEESNPLEIDDQDRNTFVTRVQGVYRKAVIRMRFFGEIWWVEISLNTHPKLSCFIRYMAYVWTNSIGKTEEAINLLKAGIEANPMRRAVLLKSITVVTILTYLRSSASS
jgi:cleavage stimulation factor subunit 3